MTDPKPTNPSSFSHTLTKIAVAQICQSIGFKSSKSAALETLTRVATLFLQSLAKSAANHASISGGRTHCNLFDVVHALEDLSLPFGFSGAADVNQPLLGSATLLQLRRFVDAIDEVPFARRIPRRVMNSGSVVFSGKFCSSSSRGPEVPQWLPEFPELRGIDDKDGGGAKDREVFWEERRCEEDPTKVCREERERGNGKFVLQGRRERVKFKLREVKRKVKLSNVDDLELRNGVCRGGKRVCLLKRVNTSRIFEDEEKSLTNGM